MLVEFSDTLFFFVSVWSTDVDPLLWLCLLTALVVVGALQFSVGELMGLVEVVLTGDSLLLLLSVVPPKDGNSVWKNSICSVI